MIQSTYYENPALASKKQPSWLLRTHTLQCATAHSNTFALNPTSRNLSSPVDANRLMSPRRSYSPHTLLIHSWSTGNANIVSQILFVLPPPIIYSSIRTKGIPVSNMGHLNIRKTRHNFKNVAALFGPAYQFYFTTSFWKIFLHLICISVILFANRQRKFSELRIGKISKWPNASKIKWYFYEEVSE